MRLHFSLESSIPQFKTFEFDEWRAQSLDPDSISSIHTKILVEQLFIGIKDGNYFWNDKKIESITDYIRTLNTFLTKQFSVDSFCASRENNTLVVRWIFNFDDLNALSWSPLVVLARMLDISIPEIQQTPGYQFFWDSGIGTMVLPFTPLPITLQFVPFHSKSESIINRQQLFVDYCLSLKETNLPQTDEHIFLNSLEWRKFKDALLKYDPEIQEFCLLHAYRIIYNCYHPNREIWLQQFDMDQLIECYPNHRIVFSSPCLIDTNFNAGKYYLGLKGLIENHPQPEKVLRDQEVQLILSGIDCASLKLTGPGSLFFKMWKIKEITWRSALIKGLSSLPQMNVDLINQMIQDYDDFSEEGKQVFIDLCHKIIEKYPEFSIANSLYKKLLNIKDKESFSLIISFNSKQSSKLTKEIEKNIKDLNWKAIASSILEFPYLCPDSIILDALPNIASHIQNPEKVNKFLECIKKLRYNLNKIAPVLIPILSSNNPLILKQALMDFLVKQDYLQNREPCQEGDQLMFAAMQLSLAKEEVSDEFLCNFVEKYFDKSYRTEQLFCAFSKFMSLNQANLSFKSFYYLIEKFCKSCKWATKDFIDFTSEINLAFKEEELHLLIILFRELDDLCRSTSSAFPNKTNVELLQISQKINSIKLNILMLLQEPLLYGEDIIHCYKIFKKQISFSEENLGGALQFLIELQSVTKSHLLKGVELAKKAEDFKELNVLALHKEAVQLLPFVDLTPIFFDIFSILQKESVDQAKEFARVTFNALIARPKNPSEKLGFAFLIYHLLDKDISILQSIIQELVKSYDAAQLSFKPLGIFWFSQLFLANSRQVLTSIDFSGKDLSLTHSFFLLHFLLLRQDVASYFFEFSREEITDIQTIMDILTLKKEGISPSFLDNKAFIRRTFHDLVTLDIEMSTPIFGMKLISAKRQGKIISIQEILFPRIEQIDLFGIAFATLENPMLIPRMIQSYTNFLTRKEHKHIIESWLPSCFNLYQTGKWEEDSFYNFFLQAIKFSRPSLALLSFLNYHLEKFRINKSILDRLEPISDVLIGEIVKEFLSCTTSSNKTEKKEEKTYFSTFSLNKQLDIFNQLTTGILHPTDSDFYPLFEEIVKKFLGEVKARNLTAVEQAFVFDNLLVASSLYADNLSIKKKITIVYNCLPVLAPEPEKNSLLKLILGRVTSSFLKEKRLMILEGALLVLKDMAKRKYQDEDVSTMVRQLLEAYKSEFQSNSDKNIEKALIEFEHPNSRWISPQLT